MVQYIYSIFYLLFFLMAATGLVLAFEDVEWLKPAFSGNGFFNKAFPAYGDTGTGYNRATSTIMNLAINGKYPDTFISYPLVLISKGLLPAAEKASAAIDETGNILFK
jgi:hypothetical protein